MSLLKQFALENDEIVITDIEPVETSLIDTDIDGMADDSDTLAGLHENAALVEQISDSMCKDAEVLSTESLRVYRSVLENARKKLGMSGRPVVPSLECFTSTHERKASFSIAQEGITEVLQNIWQAIVKFFKDAWTATRKYFHDVFGFIPRLNRRLEELGKFVEKTTGTPSDRDFKDEDLSSAFSVNGSLQYGEVLTILDGYQQVITSTRDVVEAVKAKLQAVESVLVKQKEDYVLLVTSLERQSSVINDRSYEDLPDSHHRNVMNFIIGLSNEDTVSNFISGELKVLLFSCLSMTEKAHVSKDVVGVSTIPLLHERRIVAVEEIELSSKDQEIEFITVRLEAKEDREISKTISVLTPAQMRSVIAKVKALLKNDTALVAISKKFDDINSHLIAITQIMSDVHEVVSKSPIASEAGITSAFRSQSETIRLMTRTMTSISNILSGEMPKEFLKVSSLSLDYVAKSLKYY